MGKGENNQIRLIIKSQNNTFYYNNLLKGYSSKIKMRGECPAILLVGGEGARLKPLTNKIPKPMIDINGKPLLLYLLGKLKKNNIKNIILCVGYLGNKIEEYFGNGKNFGMNIRYSYEKEILGTAGAIKNAEGIIDSDFFIVMNGDTFHKLNFNSVLQFHLNYNPLITMVVTPATNPREQELLELSDNDVVRFYKRDTPEHFNFLQKNPFPLINGGVYVLNKRFLDLIPPNEKVSIEHDIFPKIIGHMKGFLYKDYFKDISNLQLLNELENDMKEGICQ